MINLIAFFIIFIIIIYIIFHLFVIFSKSFQLIDEKFNNIVSNVKDKHIKNLFKENDKSNDKNIDNENEDNENLVKEKIQ